MNKDKEIKEMEYIIRADCKEWLDVAGCLPKGTSYYYECLGIAEDSAKKLSDAGYGNIERAIKDFVEELKKKFVKDYTNFYSDTIYQFTDSEIDELINEFYGDKNSCRTCKWHKHEEIDDGYVCCNGDSAKCTDWTEDDDCCELWEDKSI